LLWHAAQSIDWNAVVATLRNVDATTLATALALTAASYTLYTGYDYFRAGLKHIIDERP